MKRINACGFERVAAVYAPPVRAVETVGEGVWGMVHAGWVLPIFSAVFVIDGVLRLDGVLRVDRA